MCMCMLLDPGTQVVPLWRKAFPLVSERQEQVYDGQQIVSLLVLLLYNCDFWKDQLQSLSPCGSSIGTAEDHTAKCDSFYPVQEDFPRVWWQEAVGSTRKQIYLLTNHQHHTAHLQSALLKYRVSVYYIVSPCMEGYTYCVHTWKGIHTACIHGRVIRPIHRSSLLLHYQKSFFTLCLQRRNGEVFQIAFVPVLNHQLGTLLHLRHASFPQLAMSTTYLSQKLSCGIIWFYLVVLHNFMLGDSLENGLYDFLK